MNKKVSKELRRISESIPQEMLDRLLVEQLANPTIKLIMEKASKDKSIDPKKRKRAQMLLDSGMLDYSEMVPDPKVEEEMDAWVSKEVEKAIKLGRIPDPETDKEALAIKKKAEQWKRRKQRNQKEKVQSN